MNSYQMVWQRPVEPAHVLSKLLWDTLDSRQGAGITVYRQVPERGIVGEAFGTRKPAMLAEQRSVPKLTVCEKHSAVLKSHFISPARLGISAKISSDP